MSGFLLPAIGDWAEWAAIFTDVTLWHPVVDHVWRMDGLLRRLTGGENPRRVTGGYPGTCAVFVVDEKVVIKFFPPMVLPDFDRELAVYQLIHDHVPKIPALLAHGRFHDRIEWPYLAVSFLSGEAWRDAGRLVPTEQAAEIMRELGRIVRATHDLPLPPAGSWPAERAWELLVQSRLARAGGDLRRDSRLAESVIVEIEHMLSQENWYGEPVHLVHSDLTEDHLFIAESGNRWSITGLIDWADAEVGPPTYDWVALWFSICRRDAVLFRAFLRGYGATEDLNVGRLAAMTYLHRFGANIISDGLPPEDQRSIGSLAELNNTLFRGLDSQAQ